MKFGIGLIPQSNTAETVNLIRLAEEAGFEYAWIFDKTDIDIYKLLRNTLLETESIKIGPGVTNPYIRKPGKLSIEMMNLNKISGNRIVLGIGPGNKSQLDKLGILWEKPVTKLKRSIKVISDMNDKNPNHEIPIYIEAASSKLLELAGKTADGVLINASHPKDFHEISNPIEKGLEISKKDRNTFSIASYSTTSVSNDSETAKNTARVAVAFLIAGSAPHVLERHGISLEAKNRIYLSLSKGDIGGAMRLISDDIIDEFSTTGNPDEVTEKIKQLEKAGVDHYIAGAPIGRDARQSIQLLGDIISDY